MIYEDENQFIFYLFEAPDNKRKKEAVDLKKLNIFYKIIKNLS
jgi:hypothetical protein